MLETAYQSVFILADGLSVFKQKLEVKLYELVALDYRVRQPAHLEYRVVKLVHKQRQWTKRRQDVLKEFSVIMVTSDPRTGN